MPEMLLAHGGSAGLFFEIAFVAAPLLLFAVMAVMTGRRRRRHEDNTDPPAEL